MNPGLIAFTLFHTIIPAVCVLLYGANPVWIAGGMFFSIASFRTAQYSSTLLAKSALCLLSGLNMFLNLMLGVSYYMQGAGFNDQYFYHLDFNTLIIAGRAYGGVFFPSVLGLILAFFVPLVFYWQNNRVRVGVLSVVLLWVAAVATVHPFHSFINYRAGFSDELADTMPRLPVDAGITVQPDAASILAKEQSGIERQAAEISSRVKKNIILIYAEGLEQLYFDEAIFGDIVPNLRQLSEQSHQFTNVFQVPGTAWTIAGIVASQCGFPLVVSNHMASNSTMASTKKPFVNEDCFADILHDSGYTTVYLGGAPLAFAGKGDFLRTHGYQKALGRTELQPLMQDPKYNMGWGLYDDSLFEFAVEELEALENGDKPYLLTLLTLDTHHPRGHPSKSCESLKDNGDPMSNAVYCSDQLISKFIKKAMDIADMEETVIVLFSDHLAMRNTLWDKLQTHKDQRRLTWMIFDNQPAALSDQVATHFDFAPTLLEKVGISGYPTMKQGVSLLTQQEARVSGAPPVVDLTQVPRSLISDATVKETGFKISYQDLTISVGDLAIKATKNGWKFSSGLFLVVLNEDGKVTDTIYSNDFAALMKELDGMFVVGISIYENNSEFGDQFFFGRISQDLGKMTIAPLDSDVQVEAGRLIF
jgi:phosphoglycerol transferase